MKRFAMMVGAAAGVYGLPVLALDVEPGSGSRAKAIAAATVQTPLPPKDPLLELSRAADANNGRTYSGACGSKGTDLCYDSRDNRIVYRPSRNWMPAIEGLTPEHVSVRRDSVVFKYSFR